MSVISSTFNDSLSLISYSLPLKIQCLVYRPRYLIFISFSITNILLLLCTLILYYGLQQWWRGHSVFSSLTASQSDSFTYHIVTMELIYSFGCILICFANYNQDLNILLVGALMYCIFPTGLERLHILTCVKHYLAVGHPITYLGLRNERGIRMRNIFSDCAWLLSMFGTGLSMKEDIFFILYFCFLNIISIITISFCSLCVLCILIRPGPGEQDRNRDRVDQSKQRAFYTTVVLLVVLVLRFARTVIWEVLNNSEGNFCLIMKCFFSKGTFCQQSGVTFAFSTQNRKINILFKQNSNKKLSQ